MEQKEHHKRELWFLIVFLALFLIIFIVGFLNLKRGVSIVGIGIGAKAENLIITALSFLAIIRVVWNILFY